MPKETQEIQEAPKGNVKLLRRTITRKTLNHESIQKKELIEAIKNLKEKGLIPPIQGLMGMEKESIVASLETWTLARVFLEYKRIIQAQQEKLENLTQAQKKALLYLEGYTTQAIRLCLKQYKIDLKGKNQLRRSELFYNIVVSQDCKKIFDALETAAKTPTPVTPIKENTQESTQKLPTQKPPKKERTSVKRQPSEIAIKAALRLAEKKKCGIVPKCNTECVNPNPENVISTTQIVI
jgi:hypothetical protein